MRNMAGLLIIFNRDTGDKVWIIGKKGQTTDLEVVFGFNPSHSSPSSLLNKS